MFLQLHGDQHDDHYDGEDHQHDDDVILVDVMQDNSDFENDNDSLIKIY